MNQSFSKWPGAWERQLIRRQKHPHYFGAKTSPSDHDILEAQNRDQQELAQFHSDLQTLIQRCTEITPDSGAAEVTAIKKDLDTCHDTAFGLAADLTEQKAAISTLNDVITSAMRYTFKRNDDDLRLRLIQNEAKRLEKLSRLEFPIVCDLLRTVSPIPKGEMTAALLSESDIAFKAAVAVLSIDRKEYLAKRIATIVESLDSEIYQTEANRKYDYLLKQLPNVPTTNEEPIPG